MEAPLCFRANWLPNLFLATDDNRGAGEFDHPQSCDIITSNEYRIKYSAITVLRMLERNVT